MPESSGAAGRSGATAMLTIKVERLYRAELSDPDFATICAHLGASGDDDVIAELVEADGRARLRRDLPVQLDRYLSAIPDLATRPDTLDAAIDMSLRQLAKSSNASGASADPVRTPVDQLVQRHPTLERAIREAAALSDAICSTSRLRLNLAARPSTRTLPCPFGPIAESGRHRYELLELLGEGAFGYVFLAVDHQLSETDHRAMVSIKVLRTGGDDPWARQRLIDEATKARRISHPNVVSVIDRGVSDQDEDFIVYEYVDGGDLAKYIRRRREPVTVRDAVRLAAKVASGVHAAHMAGLVHCDLKPSNVMLTADREPKVADFGIAIRTTGVSPERGREAETPLGNLAFISPEQYRLEPGSLTVPSDIYALGGILYWLLTGDLPNGSTVEQIAQAHDRNHGRATPPSAADRRAGVDRDLDQVCRRSMAILPEQRYGSAAAMADDLQAWLDSRPIGWTAPSPLRRLRLWARRKPGLAVAVASILVLVSVAAASLQFMVRLAHERQLEAAFAQVEAAVAQAELEHEERMRTEFRQLMLDFRERLNQAQADGLSTDLLPTIWVMEWLYGPTLLDDEGVDTEIWRMRIDVVRDLVERRRGAGLEDDVQTLIWESALGFWLLTSGQPHEAERLLDANVERWRSRVSDEDDPWLADIRTMRACAVVARIAVDAAEEGLTDELRAGLEPAVGVIRAATTRLESTQHASPLHKLTLRTLLVASDEQMLDDPQWHDAVERELAAVMDKGID